MRLSDIVSTEMDVNPHLWSRLKIQDLYNIVDKVYYPIKGAHANYESVTRSRRKYLEKHREKVERGEEAKERPVFGETNPQNGIFKNS